MSEEWVATLQEHVEKRPCVVIRFSDDEWQVLLESRNRVREFTVARPHRFFDKIKVPTLVIVFGTGEELAAYLGIATRCGAISTLDTRVKVCRAFRISPATEKEVLSLVKDPHLLTLLTNQLKTANPVVRLSPRVSSAVVAALARTGTNGNGMKSLADFLARPTRFTDNLALEDDAVRTALKVFGITPSDQAERVEVLVDNVGAIGCLNALEDAVIEHDARTIPGLDLIKSDLTGRAVFRKGDEELEVFTANKRPLENVMGVDLVYLNLTRGNIAMLQYKMLTSQGNGEERDWIYRPDKQLAEEIKRMETFAVEDAPGELEYRLNSGVFYLKFVRKDSPIKGGGIILPIDHFKLALRDPLCTLGERGGIRISYRSLAGRYMREDVFLALVRSGYIGPRAETTSHFAALVRRLVDNDRAVVGAIASHQAATNSPYFETDVPDAGDEL